MKRLLTATIAAAALYGFYGIAAPVKALNERHPNDVHSDYGDKMSQSEETFYDGLDYKIFERSERSSYDGSSNQLIYRTERSLYFGFSKTASDRFTE